MSGVGGSDTAGGFGGLGGADGLSGPRIVVVGGGLAGIAAALDCAHAGASVTLLESRGRLGGAAYSFTRDGLRADNGQHVFLRCCTAYRGLLDELGATGLTTLQPRLSIPVLASGGRRGQLQRTGLPAPLHLAGSLLRYPFLTMRERISVAVAMAALQHVDVDDPAADTHSFGDWLREHRQSPRAIATLWELIVRPTINLTCADASLAQAAQVFQVGLLSHAAAGDVGHAAAPLSELHDRAARAALERAGVDVRLRTGVSAIAPSTSGYAVQEADGAVLAADEVVLAVGPERAASLLPAAAGVDAAALRGLGSSPIVNLHVVYDRPVLDVPFAAGVDTPVQWVFDRTASAGLRDGQYLVVTLSAADAELTLGREALRERYLPALVALLPRAADAQVVNFFATRDHAATFRAAPGVRRLRPGPRTALPGLVLAGAFTDTGWPATMEGAVRSGHAAVAALRDAAPSSRHPASSSSRAAAGPDPEGRGRPGLGSTGLVVLAPLAIEAAAIKAGAPWASVHRVGMGAKRAARYARTHDHADASAVLIAGFCGALDPDLEPGDIVLASELIGEAGTVPCADPTLLASVLRRGGLNVSIAPIVSSPVLATGERRLELQRTRAAAVDMESTWLAPVAGGRPLTVLRVVVDTGERELRDPWATITGSTVALRSLRRAATLLGGWAGALRRRELVLGAPRASCAGVERAVEIVERALALYGAPVYVRRQIVHNRQVVASLSERGAVFVDEVDEAPPGSTLVFSAHGVSPEVRRQAQERGCRVIDATCPLVAKVHAEARRFAASGFEIVLVGHDGHEEVQGTLGEAPEVTTVIAEAEEVEELELGDRVAYLTQTTLAVDETASVVQALRARYPELTPPPSDDICYATQNRQMAVRELAADCDVILVVGSANSSNSRRLVEVAQRAGAAALLVERASEIPLWALSDAGRIGLTAGASAPEALVRDVVAAVAALGGASVSERTVAQEELNFKLPPEVRQRSR